MISKSPNIVIMDLISPFHRWGHWGLPVGWFVRGNMVPWLPSLVPQPEFRARQPEVWRGAGSPTSGPLDDPSHTVWGSPREKTALKFPTGRLGWRGELYSGHRGVTLSTLLTSLYLRLPIWKKTGSATAVVSWIPSTCWRLYHMALHRTYLVPWRTLWNNENTSPGKEKWGQRD